MEGWSPLGIDEMDCFLEGGSEAGDIGPVVGAVIFFVLPSGRGMPVLGVLGLLALTDGGFGFDELGSPVFARGGAAIEWCC